MKIKHFFKNEFVQKYEQSVQAFVYFGAAFLVIIVGLRGLGDLSSAEFIPNFILNDEGKISGNIVIAGLLFEFFMLCLLALVAYFSPKQDIHAKPEAINNELLKNIAENTSQIDNILAKSSIDKVILDLNEKMDKLYQQYAENIKVQTQKINEFIENTSNLQKQYYEKLEHSNNSTINYLNDISNKYNELIKSETELFYTFIKDQTETQKLLHQRIDSTFSKETHSLEPIAQKLIEVINEEKKILNRFSNVIEDKVIIENHILNRLDRLMEITNSIKGPQTGKFSKIKKIFG